MRPVLVSPAADDASHRAEVFEQTVQEAQDELTRSVERCELRNDPYGQLITAMASALGVFPAFADRMEHAISEAKRPLNDDVVEHFAHAAAAKIDAAATQAAKMWRSKAAIVIALVLLLSHAAMFGIGFRLQPDLTDRVCRLGDKHVDEKTHRPICSISLWAE